MFKCCALATRDGETVLVGRQDDGVERLEKRLKTAGFNIVLADLAPQVPGDDAGPFNHFDLMRIAVTFRDWLAGKKQPDLVSGVPPPEYAHHLVANFTLWLSAHQPPLPAWAQRARAPVQTGWGRDNLVAFLVYFVNGSLNDRGAMVPNASTPDSLMRSLRARQSGSPANLFCLVVYEQSVVERFVYHVSRWELQTERGGNEAVKYWERARLVSKGAGPSVDIHCPCHVKTVNGIVFVACVVCAHGGQSRHRYAIGCRDLVAAPGQLRVPLAQIVFTTERNGTLCDAAEAWLRAVLPASTKRPRDEDPDSQTGELVV